MQSYDAELAQRFEEGQLIGQQGLAKYLSQCFQSIQIIDNCLQFSKDQLKKLWLEAYDKKKLKSMQAILKLSKLRFKNLKSLKKNKSTNFIFADFKLRVDRFWIQIFSMLTQNTRYNQSQLLSLYLQFVDFSFILIDSAKTFQKQKSHIIQIIQYCKIILFRKNNYNQQQIFFKIERSSTKEQIKLLTINLSVLYSLYQKQFQNDAKKRQKQMQQVNQNLLDLIVDIQKRDFLSFFMKLFNAHLFELNFMFTNGFMNFSVNNNIKTELQYSMKEAEQQTNFQIKLDYISIIAKYIGRFTLLKNISFQVLEDIIHRILQVLVTSFSTLIKKKIQKIYYFMINNDILLQLKQIIIFFWKNSVLQKQKKALYFFQTIKKIEMDAKRLIKARLSCNQPYENQDRFNYKDQTELYYLQDIQTTYQNSADNIQQRSNAIGSANENRFNSKTSIQQKQSHFLNKNLFKNQFILIYYQLFYEPFAMKIYFEKNFYTTQQQIFTQSKHQKNMFSLATNDFIKENFKEHLVIIQSMFQDFHIIQTVQEGRTQIQKNCQKVVQPKDLHNILKNRPPFQQIFFLYYFFQFYQQSQSLLSSMKSCLLQELTPRELNNIIQLLIFDLQLKNINFLKLNTYMYRVLMDKIKIFVNAPQLGYDYSYLKQLSRMLKYYSLLSNGFSLEQTQKLAYCKNCQSIFKSLQGISKFQLMCSQCRIGFLDRLQFPQAQKSCLLMKLKKTQVPIQHIISKRILKLKKNNFQHLNSVFLLKLLEYYESLLV